jgi:hypothetical protein
MSPRASSKTMPSDGSSRQLQWPFVGIAVLLVALIILTPNLFSTGSAGLQTRAQLIVERASPGGNTSFYVESIGTSTLYQSIQVSFAPLPSWPYKGTAAELSNWTWVNGTETLVLVAVTAMNPVAINVTVNYTVASGLTTYYVGTYAFFLNDTTMTLQAVGLLTGAAPPTASTPLANLPIFLTLAIRTPTGVTQ